MNSIIICQVVAGRARPEIKGIGGKGLQDWVKSIASKITQANLSNFDVFLLLCSDLTRSSKNPFLKLGIPKDE
jgi:hypothetical protein